MTDTERLDWLARAGDVSISVIQDAPRDGEYCIMSDVAPICYGETFRDAVDSAIHSSNAQHDAGGRSVANDD